MKKLKEVIKLKCKLLSNIDSPLYFLPPDNFFNIIESITIYSSKNSFTSRDELTLLEEISPLLVYLCSCIIYCGGEYYDLLIKLYFNTSELVLDNSINVYYDGLFKNPLNVINDNIMETRSFGYCLFFTDTFKLELILRQNTNNQYYTSDEEEEEEKILPDKTPINDFKTFKVEQCVICLENIPNVLFCNCGHICVCESCKKEFTNCPICKKENTVLRII